MNNPIQGKKRGLGKGLDSLLSSSTVNRNKQVSYDIHAEKAQQLSDDNKSALAELNVTQLQPGKYQPRLDMSPEALDELANSIRSQGILQPIVVRETGHQKYEILAGERRWRAAKLVGLQTVPCLIKNVEDNAAIAIALIENIQRRGERFEKIALAPMEGLLFVSLDEIIYCESQDNYTQFFLTDGRRIMVSKTIKYFEEALDADKFFRVLRSNIINLKYIDKYVNMRHIFQ